MRGCGAFADELVEVVGLGGGEFPHGEVVEDENGGAGVFAEAAVPGAVGVAAGQVGQGAAGFGEADVGAGPDGEVAEGLGDVAFPDADRSVENHGLAGVQPAQCGQVADLGGGEFGAGVEVGRRIGKEGRAGTEDRSRLPEHDSRNPASQAGSG